MIYYLKKEKEGSRDRKLEARLSEDHADAPLWPINIECEGGTLSGSYYPQTAIEALTRRYEEMKLSKSKIKKRVAYARKLMNQEIRSALSSALEDFVLESVFIQTHHHFVGKLPDSAYERLQQRVGEQSLLRAGVDPYQFKWDEGILALLKSYYDEVYPAWQSVAKIIKQNLHSSDILENVLKEVTYMHRGVQQNLIERMIEGKKKKGMLEATASPIALEHAARLCGLPPDSITPRQLRKHLTKANKLARKK